MGPGEIRRLEPADLAVLLEDSGTPGPWEGGGGGEAEARTLSRGCVKESAGGLERRRYQL